ncbi:MAG TPA: histidine--tRNA ligase [Oligoflexia bacterium]|nr:histidine--tRNA ligase [Oligoflexia bacterium]HMP47118.1 histidine--tRNA ligase [Oligoflexia bacterium]
MSNISEKNSGPKAKKQGRIEPRILKGFRDELPDEALQRSELFDKIRNIFQLSGFDPIDTPSLEYSEILLGSGSEETDKQLFRFQDQGGRDIALRFDLTVPLARFVSQHANDLTFPFRRHHIAQVWRAEKPQKGRFREFYQCDFDIIGSESAASDIEILMTAHRILKSIGAAYTIRFNHRALLNGILENYCVQNKAVEALRAIDKLEKQGSDAVKKELVLTSNMTEENASLLVETVNNLQNIESPQKILEILANLDINKSESSEENSFSSGLKRISEIISAFENSGIDPTTYKLDLSIARGLEYYTGLVFETKLVDMPEIGSVCSGGRYDNLASMFSSRKLPGVGGSVGIDRLLVALREIDTRTISSQTQVLVTMMDQYLLDRYVAISSLLRDAGIRTELYTDFSKLGAQFKYADKKNIPLVLVMGSKEIESGSIVIKDLKISGKNISENKPVNESQYTCSIDLLIPTIKKLLNGERPDNN